MTKAMLAALLLAMTFSGQVFAQEETEGESTMKIEDAADKKNKVEGDIDQEITNARMRAESGSKSKFSLSSSINYTGGSFDKPFGERRPNIAGTPGNQVRTSMGIALDGRYRWSKNDSVTLGTEAALMTPFQGDVDGASNQLNVFDPVIGYSRVGKVGWLQTSSGISAGFGTSKESQAVDYTTGLGLSVTGLHTFQSGLTAGLSVSTGYNFYGNNAGEQTDDGTAAPGYYGGDRRTQWSLGIYPFAEYAFNDTYSFRTVFGYFNWRHLYGDDNSFRLLQTYVYQSIGIGISVTRDIYLYPNIQFVPDNVRDDFTNVALSATLNVF